MDKVRQLKGLKSQRKKHEIDLRVLRESLHMTQDSYNLKKKQLDTIQRKIDKLEKVNEPRVSEHAMLRYIERVMGVDLEEVKKKILTDDILKMIKTLGGEGSYPGDGFSIRMQNYTVTTVITKDGKRS